MPATVPDGLTDPCSILLLLQVPPVDVVDNAVVLPVQTNGVPVIAFGNAFTVTVAVVVQVVGNV